VTAGSPGPEAGPLRGQRHVQTGGDQNRQRHSAKAERASTTPHGQRAGRTHTIPPARRATGSGEGRQGWVPAPGQDQPASHHRPHLRADLRLPRGSGIRGHPDEHVAAAGMRLVPVQAPGGEPASGLALQRRHQQPIPLRGRGQPGQGQDIEVVTVEMQGIRDARHPFARAGRPAEPR